MATVLYCNHNHIICNQLYSDDSEYAQQHIVIIIF